MLVDITNYNHLLKKNYNQKINIILVFWTTLTKILTIFKFNYSLTLDMHKLEKIMGKKKMTVKKQRIMSFS